MVYSWAFRLGYGIIRKLERIHVTQENKPDVDKISKYVERILLNLRSEALPEKFRRELMNIVIEEGVEISIPEEIKTEKAWRVDEFYRYSTQILAGINDSLVSWREKLQKQQGKEKAEGESE
jgi:hypothetical protein